MWYMALNTNNNNNNKRNIYNLLYLSIRVLGSLSRFFIACLVAFFKNILLMLASTEQRHIWNVKGEWERKQRRSGIEQERMNVRRLHNVWNKGIIKYPYTWWAHDFLPCCLHTISRLLQQCTALLSMSSHKHTEQIKMWTKTRQPNLLISNWFRFICFAKFFRNDLSYAAACTIVRFYETLLMVNDTTPLPNVPQRCDASLSFFFFPWQLQWNEIWCWKIFRFFCCSCCVKTTNSQMVLKRKKHVVKLPFSP